MNKGLDVVEVTKKSRSQVWRVSMDVAQRAQNILLFAEPDWNKYIPYMNIDA